MRSLSCAPFLCNIGPRRSSTSAAPTCNRLRCPCNTSAFSAAINLPVKVSERPQSVEVTYAMYRIDFVCIRLRSASTACSRRRRVSRARAHVLAQRAVSSCAGASRSISANVLVSVAHRGGVIQMPFRRWLERAAWGWISAQTQRFARPGRVERPGHSARSRAPIPTESRDSQVHRSPLLCLRSRPSTPRTAPHLVVLLHWLFVRAPPAPAFAFHRISAI